MVMREAGAPERAFIRDCLPLHAVGLPWEDLEDNVDITDFIRIQLEMWGHEVSVAHDGPSGLEAALRLRPDIALLDVGLPGMDGYELAQRIRRDPVASSLRLVAMTGYGRPEDRARSRSPT